MRMIVRRTLRQAGCSPTEVLEASNGAEALVCARETPPDLILCDWNMPEMSGIELLTRLQAEKCPSKFVFVTSESTPDMRARALNAGALTIITKPFTPESFEAALG